VEIGPIPWSVNFAYGIGLIATDGHISITANGYSSIGFTSKDRELVETFKLCLGLTAKTRTRQRLAFGKSFTTYETRFSSVQFAQWLAEIGVTPRKSLTLGELNVPTAYFVDTLRGLLDGDGRLPGSLTLEADTCSH
jgi:LAGLIDADG-like domain